LRASRCDAFLKQTPPLMGEVTFARRRDSFQRREIHFNLFWIALEGGFRGGSTFSSMIATA
jgi:hypothetical protein